MIQLLSWRAHEARSRALVKTLLYRAFMLLITISVAFLVTGNGTDAISIGLATNLLKTGTYYFYERAWARVTWGTAVEA